MKTFLRWLLFVSVSTVGFTLAYEHGIVEEIWTIDTYYISTAIFALFVYATASCGYLALQVGITTPNIKKLKNEIKKEKQSKEIDRNLIFSYEKQISYVEAKQNESIMITLERNWFIASILSSMGFIGTIVGMIIMTNGIGGMDLANVNLTEFGTGMSMALYTTGVGLVCRVFLRTQCFTIQQELGKLQEKIIHED